MSTRPDSSALSPAAAAYDFDLPAELIAQEPPLRRGDSRLLLAGRGGGVQGSHPFAALPELLRSGDLLVLNDSRVLPARLQTRRCDTGGRVVLLLLEPDAAAPGAWSALARPARRLRAGLQLALLDADDRRETGLVLELVAGRGDGEVVVRPLGDLDLAAAAERHGDVPLPPYIRRPPDAEDAAARRRLDRERYQTIYARDDSGGSGSVAAPTAGLHFCRALLESLAERGIAAVRLTLHVGAGTFRPPSAEQVASGRLHPERFGLPATTAAAVRACRGRGGRVVAVGTTSLRVLETVARLDLPDGAAPGTRLSFGGDDASPPPVFVGEAVRMEAAWRVDGVTRLFIQPPDAVTAADGLLTNFHLPGSSLLRLVAAFTGEAAWREAYRDAVARRLRFFSYGDAMLILPPPAREER